MERKHFELIDLASKFHDEALDSRELARLNELLGDEEARCVFVELSEVHIGLKQGQLPDNDLKLAGTLRAVHRRIIPDSALNPQSSGGLPGVELAPRPSAFARKVRGRWMRPAAISLGTAATLAVAAFYASRWTSSGSSGLSGSSRETQVASQKAPESDVRNSNAASQVVDSRQRREYVARIVAATKIVSWVADGAPGDFLLRLSPGEKLTLAEGLVQLEFVGGAQVILNGPAEFEILDAASARLISGSLTGRSEKGNFTLQTPKAEVIDIGTEFGVSVAKAAGTKVAVFEGEVHVKSAERAGPESVAYRLTKGMAVNIDEAGVVKADPKGEVANFQRRLPPAAPTNLGVGELSLIDVVCGSRPGEYRIAGAIDPLSGHWGDGPWNQPKGVEVRPGEGRFVAVDWNPLVNGLFIPASSGASCQTDSTGKTIRLPQCSGASWGPIWARRRIGADLDPFAHNLDQDDEGFWGAGTVTAMLDRLRWVRDGLVGMHANIGLTIDLDAIRRERSASVSRLHGIVTLLERSHVSQPFNPKSLADFHVYVDGQERYTRLGFSREDGDAQFGASIEESDRFLTIVVTDAGDGNLFDRVILIDPVLELTKE